MGNRSVKREDAQRAWREVAADLERLAQLRAKPGFATLLSSLEDIERRCSQLSILGGSDQYPAEECEQRAEVYHLLLLLLRGGE